MANPRGRRDLPHAGTDTLRGAVVAGNIRPALPVGFASVGVCLGCRKARLVLVGLCADCRSGAGELTMLDAMEVLGQAWLEHGIGGKGD